MKSAPQILTCGFANSLLEAVADWDSSWLYLNMRDAGLRRRDRTLRREEVQMTVEELIALLEDCDPDAEVRLAHQPSWPLAFELRGVAVPDDAGYEGDEADAPAPGVVWLVEGGHPDGSPYAPGYLWDIAWMA
jgi:hypothetical protein